MSKSGSVVFGLEYAGRKPTGINIINNNSIDELILTKVFLPLLLLRLKGRLPTDALLIGRMITAHLRRKRRRGKSLSVFHPILIPVSFPHFPKRERRIISRNEQAATIIIHFPIFPKELSNL